MRVYVVAWFIRIPRRDHPTGWDRGRKGHASLDAASRQWDELSVVADAATDGRELQHVELREVDIEQPNVELVVALIDDAWAEPSNVRGHDAHRDDERTPWVSGQRILRHWTPASPELTPGE